MRKIVSMALCAALVLSIGAMAGCNQSSGSSSSTTKSTTTTGTLKNKTIKVWGEFGSDYYQNFKKDYPDINLDHGTSSDNSLATLAAAISAGNQPDMYYTNSATSAPLGLAYYEGLIQPLDKYLTTDTTYNLKSLPSWYNKFVSYNSHIYAIFTDLSVPCLVWNKNLFKQANLDPDTPPKTQSQMLDMAKKLTKFNSNGMVTQAAYTDKWWFQAWRLTYGTPYQAADGKISINTQETKAMLEFLLKFPQLYGGWDKVPDSVNWDAGNVAMSVADVGYAQKMSNANFQVGIAPLPSPDNYNGKQVVSGYEWQWYGIPKGAKNPDGGWLFAKWAVTKGVSGVMERAAQKTPDTFVPVYMTDPKSKQSIFNKYLGNVRSDIKATILEREKIYDQINTLQPVNAPDNSRFDAILDQKMVDIINGKVTVNDGLADLQTAGDFYYQQFLSDVGKKTSSK